jgi:hypothetical protein
LSSSTELLHDSPALAEFWVRAVAENSREVRRREEVESRWSLAERFTQPGDWAKLLAWAKHCPPASVPAAGSLTGGLLLLSVAAAVARQRGHDEALWGAVCDSVSPSLALEWFGPASWPCEAARRALEGACEHFHLRHQLDLPGKKRYWRTVLLQIGLSPVTPPHRLAWWLLGYSLPETVATLLDAQDRNGSKTFSAMWELLQQYGRGSGSLNPASRLQANPWFHPEFALPHLIVARATQQQTQHDSKARTEDESDSVTLFAAALWRSDRFTLALSATLPACLLERPLPATQLRLGGLTYDLELDAGGAPRLPGSGVALHSAVRVLHASLYQRGEQIYRERIELWPEDTDLLAFNGRSGQRVADLSTFLPSPGCPFYLLTAADVCLTPPAAEVKAPDERWRLHCYPEGLPQGLSATIEGFPLWTLPESTAGPSTGRHGTLFITVSSPATLDLRATVPGPGKIGSFRFAGRTFSGSSGQLQASSWRQGTPRAVPALLDTGERVELRCQLVVQTSCAVWTDETGDAHALTAESHLDASAMEGQPLSILWNPNDEADCWLMLGNQPLRPDPAQVRLMHLSGMGEPFTLRYGLMNAAERRDVLSASVISTGQLARVERESKGHCLWLRQPSLRCSEYRVHVWEANRSVPRLVDSSCVVAEASGGCLRVFDSSIREPIGWALSLERLWKGSRFAVEPELTRHNAAWERVQAAWLELLDPAYSPQVPWAGLAFALRWWRFPMLMEPFRPVLRTRVEAHPGVACSAWMRGKGDQMLCRPGESDAIVPFRELLWDFRPNDAQCASVLGGLWNQKDRIFADEHGSLFRELDFLLRANPILLAHLVFGVVKLSCLDRERELHRAALGPGGRDHRDPRAERALEQDSTAEAHAVIACLCEVLHAQFGLLMHPVEERQVKLRELAQRELTSWTDTHNLNDTYFQKVILQVAEQAHRTPNVPAEQLRIAIARSPATRAYLTCHITEKLIRKGFQ